MVKWFLIALAVFCALIVIFYPYSILLAYPLYFLMGLLLPFLFYAATAIVVRLCTCWMSSVLSWGLAALAILAVAVLVPWFANRPTDELIAESRAGDRDLERPLPPIKTLAYLGHALGRNGRSCNEICQRLLYDGTVDAVLIGQSSARGEGAEQETTAYRIDQRDVCPPAALSAQTTTATTQAAAQAAKETTARVRARIAEGECLIEEPGKLQEADAVVVDQKLRLGDAHTLVSSVDRVSLSIRTPEGLQERFRRTSVRYSKVDTPLLIGLFGRPHGTFASLVGVSTSREQIGNVDMLEVFVNDLGLNVAVPPSNANQREILAKAIADKSRQPGDAAMALAEAAIDDIAAGGPQPSDAELVAALVTDNRIALPFRLPKAVHNLGPEGAMLAGPLLDRILTTPIDDHATDIYAASQSLYALPPRALAAERDKLVAVASDAKRGDMAYLAIARLADSGAQNVPLLRQRLRSDGDKRGALMALCRLGQEAEDAVPEVVALTSKGSPRVRQLAERTRIRISGPTNPAPEPTPAQLRGKIDPRPERARTDAVSIACRP